MLGKSVPGADRLAIIALGDEDIDVDRVAILQFGHHLDEPVDSALRQSRLPFAGIDDVVHVVPHDLDAGYEQLAFLVLGQQILLDILIPQRAMAIGIDHIDMEADCGVVAPCLADEPAQAFERCGVMGQFQPRVDLVPGGIAMVMAPFLPADEVDDLGDAAGEVVGFADHLQRLLKRAEHIMRLLEERLFRQSLHRFPLHSQKEFRHQALVVIAVEGGDHHIRAGGMLLAILFPGRLNAGDAPCAGQNLSIFNGDNLHAATGLGGGGGDCGGRRIDRQPLPSGADGSEGDSRGPMGIAHKLERWPVEGNLKAIDRHRLRSRGRQRGQCHYEERKEPTKRDRAHGLKKSCRKKTSHPEGRCRGDDYATGMDCAGKSGWMRRRASEITPAGPSAGAFLRSPQRAVFDPEAQG